MGFLSCMDYDLYMRLHKVMHSNKECALEIAKVGFKYALWLSNIGRTIDFDAQCGVRCYSFQRTTEGMHLRSSDGHEIRGRRKQLSGLRWKFRTKVVIYCILLVFGGVALGNRHDTANRRLWDRPKSRRSNRDMLTRRVAILRWRRRRASSGVTRTSRLRRSSSIPRSTVGTAPSTGTGHPAAGCSQSSCGSPDTPVRWRLRCYRRCCLLRLLSNFAETFGERC